MFERRYKSHHDSRNILKDYIQKKEVDREYYMTKLDLESDRESKVLYLHVPFCDKICSFCNLNRKQLDNDLEDYTSYLVEDLIEKSRKKYIRTSEFEAIYFGGGTPSILKESQLELIFKTIRENYSVHKDYEWTIETTLHNLSDEKIKIFNKYGINRLSIGIQTFSDKGRKFLNRTYSKKEVIERIKKLKNTFRGYLCADIIYNYKNQSLQEVEEDAKLVKELGMDSVSFYSLMIHKGSKLSKINEFEQSREKDILCYNKFYKEMERSEEWELLELTKFLRKGRDKYKYISLRNNGAETLAIGQGAGGYMKNISNYNILPDTGRFHEEMPIHKKYRKLSGQLQFKYYDLKKIRRLLNDENYIEFLACLDYFEEHKMGIKKKNYFELSKKGVFWGNNIAAYISAKLIEGEFKSV